MSGNTRIAVAIHIMTSLAFAEESMTSSELAGSVNTNAVVVRRLLPLLARAGLIQCASGKSGGAMLARDADKISLADIYNAVSSEDVLFPIPEKRANRGCPVSCQMRSLLKEVFDQAENAVQDRFKTVMLSQLAQGIR